MNKVENKSQSGNNTLLILGLIAAIAFCAIAGGYLYASSRSEKDVLITTPVKDEGKAAGTVVSLLDESIEAQRQTDNILLVKDNWQLVEEDRVEILQKVEASSARVKLSQRELIVGIPADSSVRGAAEWLSNRIQGRNIYVLSQEFVRYRRNIGYEMQLGIKVKAGTGSRHFVTDKITFLYNDNLTVPDKDVKDYPDEEPKEKPKQKKKVKDDDVIIERPVAEKSFVKPVPKSAVESSSDDEEDDEEEEVAAKSADDEDEDDEEEEEKTFTKAPSEDEEED